MPALESLFNKVAGIQRATSSKKLTPVQIFYCEFCKIVVFYIHPPTTASEKALNFTKNFSVFKASCEKEFVLFSFFVLFSLFIPAQIQVWTRINWCWCGTSYAIFTCLASGVWWIPHLMERFYGCVTKSALVRACVLIGAILIVF